MDSYFAQPNPWGPACALAANRLINKPIPKKKNPIRKIEHVRKLFNKDKNFQEMIGLYEMFRKIEELKTERIGEFRKNVALKIYYRGKEINVNLEQLKIYADKLEKFISTTKQFLLK